MSSNKTTNSTLKNIQQRSTNTENYWHRHTASEGDIYKPGTKSQSRIKHKTLSSLKQYI